MAKTMLRKECIAKENALRLRWFAVNEKRLEEIANAESIRTVPEKVKEEMQSERIARFKNIERHGRKKPDDPNPYLDSQMKYDHMITNIMMPVDENVKKLLFSGTQKDGRKNYLSIRNKIIPEKKYYFPETSSFVYGWHMWNANRDIPRTSFGRLKVIKEFYRRAGVNRDPDWEKEPAKLSPTICGSI